VSFKRFLVLGAVLFLGAVVAGACGGRSQLFFENEDASLSDASEDAADAADAREEGETGPAEAGDGGEAGDASEAGPAEAGEAGEAGDASPDAEAGTDSSFIDSGMPDTGSDSGAPETGSDSGVPETGSDSSIPEAGNDGASDGGTAEGGEGGTDAAIDAPAEGSSPITCGTMSCDPTTQECCVAGGGAMCTTIGQCTGVNLPCTGSDNCPSGEVCCVSITGGAPSSSCEATCGGGGGPPIQLCNSNADCTMGRRCVHLPIGVGVCL
jgi:hypothetical protein